MFIRSDHTPMRFKPRLLFFVLISVSLESSYAEIGSRAFIPVKDIDNSGGSAVDAKGARYDGKNYPHLVPWMKDVTKTLAPEYPDEERKRRHEGVGLFRFTLDLKTGAVSKVTVIKSTGFSQLDRSAVLAYRRWRWKPGKWREITINTRFTIDSRPPAPTPPGAIPLPDRQ